MVGAEEDARMADLWEIPECQFFLQQCIDILRSSARIGYHKVDMDGESL